MMQMSLNGLLSILEGGFELPAVRTWALMTAIRVPNLASPCLTAC